MSVVNYNMSRFYNFYDKMNNEERNLTMRALNYAYGLGYQKAQRDNINKIKRSKIPRFNINNDDDDYDDDED